MEAQEHRFSGYYRMNFVLGLYYLLASCGLLALCVIYPNYYYFIRMGALLGTLYIFLVCALISIDFNIPEEFKTNEGGFVWTSLMLGHVGLLLVSFYASNVDKAWRLRETLQDSDYYLAISSVLLSIMGIVIAVFSKKKSIPGSTRKFLSCCVAIKCVLIIIANLMMTILKDYRVWEPFK